METNNVVNTKVAIDIRDAPTFEQFDRIYQFVRSEVVRARPSDDKATAIVDWLVSVESPLVELVLKAADEGGEAWRQMMRDYLADELGAYRGGTAVDDHEAYMRMIIRKRDDLKATYGLGSTGAQVLNEVLTELHAMRPEVRHARR